MGRVGSGRKRRLVVQKCLGVINLGGEVQNSILYRLIHSWIWFSRRGTPKLNSETSLSGPVGQVFAMVEGNDLLFAGMQAWSLENLQCIQTVTEHTSVVMSFLCWDQFLLSSSLDQKLKIWAATQSGNLEVTYTHEEDHARAGLSISFPSSPWTTGPALTCVDSDGKWHRASKGATEQAKKRMHPFLPSPLTN